MRDVLGRATRALVVFGSLLCAAQAVAQTPVASSGVPAESFLGEQFCFATNLTNIGSPGYGPYLRLELPPTLSFDSAQIFDSPLTVVANSLFPTTAPFTLPDPLFLPASGNTVTGTGGNRLVILQLPVGSITQGGPPLETEICLTIQPDAQVGVSIPVRITPVHRFGDTPTGVNGSIVGATPVQGVIPTVIEFEKTNTAPESERPPGPAWPYDYVLTVDIANTATLNPLVIADTLPPDVQYVGPVTIVGGSGCAVSAEPSTSTPGGDLVVTCSGATTGTTSDTDVVVTVPVHIVDTLDEGSCATETQINDAFASATYLPSSPGFPAQPLGAIGSVSEVEAKHVAVQKSVSPGQGAPGTAVTYTLQFQTTQYGTTNALSVVDTLPDGIDFTAHGSLTVGGNPVTIVPTVVPGTNDSATYDIRLANGADFPPATAITLTYTGVVRQTYEIPGAPPVLAADALTNTVVATYGLAEGAAGCSDGSAATFIVDPVNIRKQLLTPGPFVPGQYVTFRLSMDIPSGDTQNVVFRDFFPLPVFDVNDIVLTYGGPDIYRAVSPPALGADTMNLVPTLAIDPATNALILTYPNIDTEAPQTVGVDVRVRVQPRAFADDLFLTNIFRARSSNTANEEAASNAPVQINVRAPALALTKGVLSTSGSGTIAPASSIVPVNGNLTGADAGDQVVFRITVENTGGAPAYDVVVTDAVPAELGGASCTFTARLADNTPLTTTGSLAGGLTLVNGSPANPVLAPNDGNGAAYSNDTAFVDVTCTLASTIEPNVGTTNYNNIASATWKPQPAATPGVQTFPPVQDNATVAVRLPAIGKTVVATSESSTTGSNVAIGEIVRYRLAIDMPEGRIPDMRVVDVLPAGLQFLNDGTAHIAFVSNTSGTITSSTLGSVPTVIGDAHTVATPPLTFDLPSAAIRSAGNCAVGSFGDGTDICFLLGDVTNADNDGAPGAPNLEFVVIEFNVLVVNVTGNQAGGNRDNLARVNRGTTQLAESPSVRVTIREPNVSLAKTVNPSSGVQAGNVVTYRITISNSNAANTLTAFDIGLQDVLPAQLQLDTGSLTTVTSSGTFSPPTFTAVGNTITGSIASMNAGASITIQYTATVLVASQPGSPIVNAARAVWSSLPGTSGTGTNPTGSTVPGASGAATGERNGDGGTLNDYVRNVNAPIATVPVTLAKAVTATSLGYTGTDRFRAAVADLAIGETATFRIVATVPDGTASQVVISDTLPIAGGRMEYVSSQVVAIGSGLVVATPAPAPVVTDTLVDGFLDTGSYNFGQVVNDPGNNDPATIEIEVVGRLIDHADNTNGDALTNNARVSYGSGIDGTAQAPVDVVEPLLVIDKSSPTTTGQAGDSVTFTVDVRHLPGSAAEARAPRIVDVLPSPAGLVLNPASVAVVESGTCAPTPVPTNNSAGNTVDLQFDRLPIGCVLTVTYTAVLDNNVVVNTDVINTANLSWHSIEPGNPAGPGRAYSDSDDHTVRVSSPGVVKSVVSVVPDIGSGQLGVAQDVPIGGVVTWQFDVEMPAGDSLGTLITDQLPTGNVSFDVESSRIVSVGSGITGLAPTTTPLPGPSGVASDSDGDTHDDRVTWSLGDLRAAPVAAANRTIRFEVVSRVMDTPLTAGGVTVTNSASFTASTVPVSISGTATVDIVEPLLDIAKSITNLDPAHIVQAGDTVSFELVVSHRSASTATAFNVVVTDLLPNPGLSFLPASVGGTCAAVANASAAPSITFAFDDLTLAEASCTITYSGTVTNTVTPGTTYENLASAEWDSLQVPGPGNRHGTTGTVRDDFTILAPSLVKVVASTSLGDTATSQHSALDDLAIGELVTYTLTIGFPQGTTTNAVLVDSLPAGLVAVSGGTPELGNGGIATSLPGLAVVAPDSVTFDFGTITNPANGVETDDWIRVTVIARVADIAANTNADVLTNTATFTNGTSPAVQHTADIELVEPTLTLTKAMTATANAGATITLTITNNGTGPAYDIVLEDALSHTVWDAGSIALAGTPAGFTGVLDTGTAGQTTVRFTSNTGIGLLPGNSVIATFTATLATFPPTPNPVQNDATVPTHGSVPIDPSNPDIRVYDPVGDDATLGVPAPVITKTVSNTGSAAGGAFAPGDTVIFSIAVRNAGPVALTDATLTDIVPTHTTFVAASSDAGWVCPTVAAGETCTLTPFSVAAGATSTFAFAVQIVDPLPAGITQVANQAFLTAPLLPPTPIPSDDPDQPGPEDETPAPVLASPALTLVKTDNVIDGENIAPGETLVYTLAYENIGNQTATGVVLTETVPAHTTYNATASAPDAWTCVPASGAAGATCTFDVGNLPVGVPETTLFAVTLDAPVPAGVTQIVNTAVIADDRDNTDTDDETTPLDALPGLHITKSDNGVSTVPGGVVAYTLRYWNDGDQDSAGVVISETVPQYTTFNPAQSATGWTCANAGIAGDSCTLSVGTLPGGTPAANASTTIFAVTVDAALPAGVEQVANTAVITDDDNNTDSGSDDTPVAAAPDLTLAKTDGGIASLPGGTIAWTLSYANVGDQTATGVVIAEIVPAHTTFDAAGSTAGWTCVPDGAAGSACSFVLPAALAAGDTGSVVFAVTVDDPLAAGVELVANTAVIADDGSNGDDPTPADNTASDDTPIDALPQLTVLKDDGGASTTPGGLVTWTLTYENVGNQAASGTTLTETVPAHTTFDLAGSTPGWTCADGAPAGTVCALDVGTVAAGAPAATAAFAVRVNDIVPAGVTQLSNTVLIASDGTGGEGTDPQDDATDTTPLDAAPDLTISKTDGGVSSAPDGVIVYTLSYENVGTQDATGVVVTETVPLHTTFDAAASAAGWTCVPDGNAGSTCTLAVGAVAAGAGPVDVAFAVRVDATVPDGVTEVLNVTGIADDGSNGPDPSPINNTAQDDTPIAAGPDLTLAKTDGGITAAAGDTVVYTLTYSNVGTQDASGVVVTDTVPDNTTFVLASSSAGWSCADGAAAGTSCTYAVGNVAAGAPAATLAFAVRVVDALPAGVDTVVNTATIADDGNNGDDPTPENNTGTDDTPIDAAPDLAVAKSDGGVSVSAGDTIAYTISYANNGDQDAANAVLAETVPAHTVFVAAGSTAGWNCVDGAPAGSSCTFVVGALAAGDSGVATFVVRVDTPLPAGITQVANRVTIANEGSDEPDPTPGDNTGTDDTPVAAAPDLVVTKAAQQPVAAAGAGLVYAITYQNVGTQDATGVVLTETVPANTVFDAASSAPGWSCADGAAAGTPCSLAIGNVAAGAAPVQVLFGIVVDTPLPANAATLLNTVTIADDGDNGIDPTPENNTGSDETPLSSAPDMSIVKSTDATRVRPDDEIVYTLAYRNIGARDASGVVITETVPVGTVFVADGSAAGWSCADGAAAGTECTLDVGDVPADGSSASVTFVVRVLDDAEDAIANSASITDDGTGGIDPTPDNNADDVSTPFQDVVPVPEPAVIPATDDLAKWMLLLAMLSLGLFALRQRR